MKKILLVLLILTLVGCGLLYLLQRKTDQTIQNVSSEVKTTETGSNLYTTTTDDIKNEENRNAQVDIDQVMKIFVSTIGLSKKQYRSDSVDEEWMNKREKIIEKIQKEKTIIEHLKITGEIEDFYRFSSVSKNHDNTLGVYTLCTSQKSPRSMKEFPKLVQDDAFSYSWTEMTWCGIIEFNYQTNTNTILYLGDGGWNGGNHFLPMITYDHNNNLILDNHRMIDRHHLSDLLSEITGTNLGIGSIGVYSQSDSKNSSGNYINLHCYMDCDMQYEQDIKYENGLNYKSQNYGTLGLTIFTPYTKLQSDFNNFIFENGKNADFQSLPEEEKKIRSEYLSYLQNEDKNSFRLKVRIEGTDTDYKDSRMLYSGDILILNNINPDLVNLDFHEEKNIKHSHLRAISIQSEKISGLFIFNLHSLKGVWLNNKKFQSWEDEKNIVLNGNERLDVTRLDWSKVVSF